MSRRKTVQLSEAVEMANRMLRNSITPREARVGIMALVEAMLHTASNYQGFRYLEKNEVPEGQKPGIIPGYSHGERDNRYNQYPDETRREYYLPK